MMGVGQEGRCGVGHTSTLTFLPLTGWHLTPTRVQAARGGPQGNTEVKGHPAASLAWGQIRSEPGFRTKESYEVKEGWRPPPGALQGDMSPSQPG